MGEITSLILAQQANSAEGGNGFMCPLPAKLIMLVDRIPVIVMPSSACHYLYIEKLEFLRETLLPIRPAGSP
jgi:hypothetical protein